MSESVIVLNADYQPIHTFSLKHAVRMLVREVAVVEEHLENRTLGPYLWPKVVRLVRYVYIKFKSPSATPRYSRVGVFKRDKHKCAYCLKHANTIDHVLPQSRGGQTSWMNIVSCCRKCNERKKERTPEEAGMPLLFKPFIPTFADLT